MADEVTPIVETVPTETPAVPVVAEEAPNTVEVVAEQTPIPNPVEAVLEPTPSPVEAGSGTTAQTLNPTEVGSGATLNSVKTESGEVGGNEPLAPVVEPIAETSKPELQKPAEASLPQAQTVAPRSGIRELLVKAQSVIQFRKRKKLDAVMGLFAKRTSITNDEVEKLLHVSDATATRYLSILEKEGKIKQTGKGKGVLYVRN